LKILLHPRESLQALVGKKRRKDWLESLHVTGKKGKGGGLALSWRLRGKYASQEAVSSGVLNNS